MANEVEMSARLYAAKGGATINSLSYSAVANMTGTDMGQQTQVVGGLTLHPLTRQAKAGPISLKLGPKDFRLLQVLMAQPDRVFTRAQLLDKVWGDHVEVEDRTVDAQIKRLRDALSPAQAQGCIQTIRSVGYRLDSVAASSIPAGSGLP